MPAPLPAAAAKALTIMRNVADVPARAGRGHGRRFGCIPPFTWGGLSSLGSLDRIKASPSDVGTPMAKSSPRGTEGAAKASELADRKV